MNPRAAINDLHPVQGCPFGQLGYFSKVKIEIFNCAAVPEREKAEKEGFEPSRRLRDLSDFKSDTFNHLVTSPCGVQVVLYKPRSRLSSIF